MIWDKIMFWAKIINGYAKNKKVEKSRLIVFRALPQQWPLFCYPVRESRCESTHRAIQGMLPFPNPYSLYVYYFFF